LGIFDIGILLSLLIPALVGVIYGFLNIVLSLVAWGIAFGLAVKFSGALAPMLATYIDTEVFRQAIAFFGIFFICQIIFSALGYFVVKLLGRSGLTAADRILGSIFGLGLGGAIVSVLIFLAGFTELTRTDWWKSSLVVAPFERIGEWSRQYIPETMASYHHYGTENETGN